MDSGLIVAGSSDSPVVPNNPLMGIYAAVTRRAESGQTVLAAKLFLPDRRWKCILGMPPYATFEENIKGSLAPGKLADIVMLSTDPSKGISGADKRYRGRDDHGGRGNSF